MGEYLHQFQTAIGLAEVSHTLAAFHKNVKMSQCFIPSTLVCGKLSKPLFQTLKIFSPSSTPILPKLYEKFPHCLLKDKKQLQL